MINFTYISCPYSHPDEEVRKRRVKLFAALASKLISQGKYPVSPMFYLLLHHEAHVDFPTDWDYWRDCSLEMVRISDEVIVIADHGWDLSQGVLGEIKEAEQSLLDVKYIFPSEI